MQLSKALHNFLWIKNAVLHQRHRVFLPSQPEKAFSSLAREVHKYAVFSPSNSSIPLKQMKFRGHAMLDLVQLVFLFCISSLFKLHKLVVVVSHAIFVDNLI